MRRGALLLFAALASLALPLSAAEKPAKEMKAKTPEFELRGLNKMTARASTLKGPILIPIEFGNLEITVKSCWSAPPDKKPEHAALMEIAEHKPGEGRHVVFSGWMFASSPALSALEHPVYDITVIACHS